METEEGVLFRTQFWGVCCESGKKYSQVVQKKFRVTKAVLESPVKGTSDTLSLMVERGDCKYVLCHLKPDSILQADLNLYFDKGEKISFMIKGQGKVHLSGYHILCKDDVTESFKSNFVSPAKKEISNEKKVNKPNFIPEESEDSEEESSEEEVTSKKAPNKVTSSAKKVFFEKEKNVKKGKKDEESDDDDEDDDPFAEFEESSGDESEEEVKKGGAEKQKAGKRLWSSLPENEDDDDDESEDSDSEDISKEKSKPFQNKKKVKKDVPIVASTKNTPNVQMKRSKVINIEDSSENLNSSIGRTPMPKKKASLNANQDKSLSQKLNFSNEDAELSFSAKKTSSITASPIKSEDSNSTAPQSESKKKKKKKKKSSEGLNTSSNMEKDSPKPGKTGLSSASYSQKLPGGLEYEDVRVGNGPIAKKGRLVHVYYTGMLEGNKVFDSCEANSKPFSFKLGAKQVITGWELGIEGMKVGGKRRLKVPPHLGYKNQKMGPIPPNSTLYFNVELKAVS